MSDVYVIDIVRDESGCHAYSVLEPSGNYRFYLTSLPFAPGIPDGAQVVCFDSRPLLDLSFPIDRIVDLQVELDVRTMDEVVALFPGRAAQGLMEVHSVLDVHRDVCRQADVDVTRHSFHKMIPYSQLSAYFLARAELILYAGRQARCLHPEERLSRMKLKRALRRIEWAGFKADLSPPPPMVSTAEWRFYDELVRHSAMSADGLVRTQYAGRGTCTGRLGITGGFQTMTVPRGSCRAAVVSRHPDGWIYSFDFNAIDFRGIVEAVPEVSDLYADHADFHERTRQLCHLERFTRSQVKACTHVILYGGGVTALTEATGLDRQAVDNMVEDVCRFFEPIFDFRDSLHREATRVGYVSPVIDRRVPVAGDDSPGKVLGLYAQSHASWVFEQALVAVDRVIREERLDSRIIFPVHDELVMDVPPSEHTRDVRFRDAMEWACDDGQRRVVRMRRGKNYAEVE